MASIHFEPTLNARDRLIPCSAPLVAVSRPTTCPVDIAHHILAPDFQGFSAWLTRASLVVRGTSSGGESCRHPYRPRVQTAGGHLPYVDAIRRGPRGKRDGRDRRPRTQGGPERRSSRNASGDHSSGPRDSPSSAISTTGVSGSPNKSALSVRFSARSTSLARRAPFAERTAFLVAPHPRQRAQ
jgi:hypothetical protein